MNTIRDFETLDTSQLSLDEPEETGATIPRAYQIEMFHKAMNGNVIAVLPTGSGKTLISCLIIKHMHNIDFERKSTRLSVFLVPKVPLVSQQAKYLAMNLNMRVKHYYGAMCLHNWDDERWESELAMADVIVLTPDIFKHMLDRSHIKMSMLNLIIFDEAHYARGNHAYKVIMSQHYQHASDKPKIFGMTASPLIAKEDTQNSIRYFSI